MVDNYAEAMELVSQMEAQLPIPARPTDSFIRAMRQRSVKLSAEQELEIKRVLYTGDEGGILCDVTPFPDAKEVMLVSVTHLEIGEHPLAEAIRAYQKKRTTKLQQQERPYRQSRPQARLQHKRKKRRH